MKKLILLLSVITLSYASIGKISAIRGDAVVISNGSEIQAVLNQELEESDIIKTGNNARLQIIFNDNTVTTLGKNTSLEIKQYLLDGKNSKVNLVVDEGSFKVITGEISKLARKNFSLKAQTATIGIRGTVFVGEVGFNVNKLACLQGAIDVKLGNKTSLINSGKQISFKDTKVIKIENLKANDFSLTKANFIQEKQEIIQEKKEEKQNQNKVSSITLSSDIKAQNPNSNSKNTLKTEEQINIANEVNQEVKDLIVQQNSRPWTELTPANPIKPTEPEAKPEEPVKKDEIPWVELTPANPINKNEVPWTELKPAVSKYFDNSDKGTYYYGNNQADTKTSAELNLNNVSLSLYNRELNADKSVKAFDAYYLDGTANTINAQRYNNNSIKPASIDEETHNLSNSSITNPEGKNNLAYNSNYASFEANKNELKAQLLGLNYDLAKSDLEHFTTLRDDWNSFKDSVNQSNQDYSNYYVGNNSLAKLDFKNNTLTYYSKKSSLKDGRDEYGLKQLVINKDFLQRKEFDAKDLEYESFKMFYAGPAYIQDSKDAYKLDAIISQEHISYLADKNNLIMSISDIQDSLNISNIDDFNAKLSSWENDKNMFFEKFYVNPTKEFYYAKDENYVKLKPSDSYFASYNKLDNLRSILFELDKNNLLGIYNKNNNIIKINPNVTPYLKVEDSEYKVNITSQDADKTSIVLKATPNDATLKINSNINGDLINVKVDDLQKTLDKDKINNLIKDLKTK